MKYRDFLPLIAIFFIVINSIAQHDIVEVSTTIDSKIVTIANSFLEQTNVSGLSMAVSKNGKMIYAKGFGYADIANNINMNPETQLRTASVAKVITATAIGRLVSENKIDLDAPIKKYVPYINEKYAFLTSRQLAGHTSGMAHRPQGNGYKHKQYENSKETVQLMDTDLLFEPDTDYKYSTHAFNVLAAVIEDASGMEYMEYLNEYIFKPLDMHHTVDENINKLNENDAKLYYLKNNKLQEEKLISASYKIPGAGFRSTPIDLVKMMNAYTNNLISKEAVGKLFTSNQLVSGEKTNVGIAWRSSIDPFGNKVIEHAGNWQGARTVIVYYPEENMSISLMINTSCQILIEETAHMFAQLFREAVNQEFQTKNFESRIKLTFYAEKGEELYDGTIQVKEGKGVLYTDKKDFLNAHPLYNLGAENDFTLATNYGLLYLDLEKENNIIGKLHVYFNRNTTNPKNEKPIAIIESF